MPEDNRPLVDRVVDAINRTGERTIESSPTYTAVYQRTVRPDPLLARFGRTHPVAGGFVAALVFGGAFFVLFSLPVVALALVGAFSRALFAGVELFLALLCGAAGALFGLVVGRVWHRGEG